MKLHIKNQSEKRVELCCGLIECALEAGEEATVEVEDEDILYIDQVI